MQPLHQTIYSGIHEVIVSVFSLGGSVGLSPKPMVFTILVSFFLLDGEHGL